jgi:hypothetical protein
MKTIMLVAAGLASLSLASTAVAQQTDDRRAMREACAADFQKLCAGTEGGGGGRFKCLEDNKDKLSDGCKTAVAALQTAGASMREACAADAETLCASAAPGADRRKCMVDNKDKLSDGCKAALAALQPRAQ